MPPDLVGVMDPMDLADFIRSPADQQASPLGETTKYIGLEREFLEVEGEQTHPLMPMFFSMLAGRDLVAIDVVGDTPDEAALTSADATNVMPPSPVDAALDRHAAMERMLAEHGQADQVTATNWTLVLVVCGELSERDIAALRNLHASQKSLRIYLLAGRLRSDTDGRYVEARHVWPSMIPSLLVRLYARSTRGSVGRILAWRCVSLEPVVPVRPVLKVFHRWLNGEVLNGDEKFEAPHFEPIPPRVEGMDVKSSFSIRFGDAYTQDCQFKKKVDKVLDAVSLQDVRSAWANTLRSSIVDANEGVDKQVRENESASWNQAHASPALLGTMEKVIAKKRAKLAEDLEQDGTPWKALTAGLKQAERNRQQAIDAAEVLDVARSHFVPWPLRLGLVFASALLVLYLVYVVMYPLLNGVIANWEFWGAWLAGFTGVAAAAAMAWYYELSAGRHGAKEVTGRIQTALDQNVASVCLEFMAETHKRNQSFAWGQLLDCMIGSAKRLRTVTEGVTRDVADDTPVDVKSANAEQQLQRDIFIDGSRIPIGELRVADADERAEAVLNANEDKLWEQLKAAWSLMGRRCDLASRGSFPVPVVRQVWSRAIQTAWSTYYSAVVAKVAASGRGSVSESRHALGDQLSKLQGLSPARRPFLSCRRVDVESGEFNVCMLLVRDDSLHSQLAGQIKVDVRNLITDTQSDLPVFGMYYEEVLISLDDDEDSS